MSLPAAKFAAVKLLAVGYVVGVLAVEAAARLDQSLLRDVGTVVAIAVLYGAQELMARRRAKIATADLLAQNKQIAAVQQAADLAAKVAETATQAAEETAAKNEKALAVIGKHVDGQLSDALREVDKLRTTIFNFLPEDARAAFLPSVPPGSVLAVNLDKHVAEDTASHDDHDKQIAELLSDVAELKRKNP